MKLETISLLIIAVLLTAGVGFGQNKYETAKRIQQTIKRLAPIKSYVKSVEDRVKTAGVPDQVVADVADYNNSKEPEWKRYKSHHEYEVDERESYTTAFIWNKDGKPVQVNFTYSSPSGDWVQYVFHTYYPDGSAAKIDRELRTFMGDVIVNRVSFYDIQGEAIAEYISYRDLQTQKFVTKPESFMDMEADIYLKAGDLPFLRKGARRQLE